MKRSGFLKTILLLMGSFAFAFLLGEMVHEWGHFLAHRSFGVEGISIHLDPFGGSRILGVRDLPLRVMGITTIAGPGLNLVAGILATMLFWRFSEPAFLPLILWGPVALIQEGVNGSLGLLSPGSDAQWLARWGAPQVVLIILGVGFILGGTVLINRILYRCGVLSGKPFLIRFILLFFGLGFLMILRTVVSLFQSPEAALENLPSLVFALILAVIISGLQGVWQGLPEGNYPDFKKPTWAESSLVVGLGLGILLLQVMVP